MHHSITFDNGTETRNTWDDWHLIPAARPIINPPPLKTRYLNVQGGDGMIDLSEAVTGYPLYANRSGSLRFTAMNSYGAWEPRFEDMMRFLHGQQTKLILEDDASWYYEGRITVNEMASDRFHGTIVLDYTLGPYAWAQTATNEPWLWDPFSFETGVIGNGVFEASFSASEDVTAMPKELAWTAQETGNAFFHPKFTVTGDADVLLEIKAGNETRKTVTLAHGQTASVPRLALTQGRWLYKLEEVQVYVSTASGTATLALAASVSYQGADVFSHIEVGTTAVPLAFTAMETGQAPQQVEFDATGTLTITATTTGASAITVTQTITNGTATVDGLVMYRGGWLLNGRPATVSAATSSGTATLALKFRQGRL